VLVAPGADPLQLQLQHFAAVIRRAEPPLVTVRDGSRTLQVTLAIAQAAAGGRVVRCDNIAG
jgi:predicted dehydrogenase